jgi:hypothetical protein
MAQTSSARMSSILVLDVYDIDGFVIHKNFKMKCTNFSCKDEQFILLGVYDMDLLVIHKIL